MTNITIPETRAALRPQLDAAHNVAQAAEAAWKAADAAGKDRHNAQKLYFASLTALIQADVLQSKYDELPADPQA